MGEAYVLLMGQSFGSGFTESKSESRFLVNPDQDPEPGFRKKFKDFDG